MTAKSTRQLGVVFEPVMRSASMRQMDRMVRSVADKEVGVTLVGESGAGKEVIARRLHELSLRCDGPFVPINCAAIPEALFESELFGHERGAFTGATVMARGKVEAAGGGTLFLDEIGEMPLGMQAKLLRFLENRRYMRVGGTQKIQADVRIICATLRPIDEEVKAGRFRPDLYYRIHGIMIHVPPLRERQADIPVLAAQFLSQISATHGTKAPRLPRSVRARMLHYGWPGNVRELRNTIEALCLLRAGKLIHLGDLPPAMRHLDDTSSPGKDEVRLSLDETLETSVARIIEAALVAEKGNRARAAARLGISLRTVQRHLAS